MERIAAAGRLWRWQGASAAGGWYFITIEGAAGDAVRAAALGGQWLDARPGFGSAKVEATIGATRWRTSVFPDKASGGWLLPVKQAVRAAEGLSEGDMVPVALAL
jgi:hypothetical protein